LSITKQRLQGYRSALEEASLPFEADLALHAPAERDSTYSVKALLARRPDIDGVFAAVESLAMGSYRACEALGLSIPADVRVLSFSNSYAAALLQPPLTTITQPAYAMGKEAAVILF